MFRGFGLTGLVEPPFIGPPGFVEPVAAVDVGVVDVVAAAVMLPAGGVLVVEAEAGKLVSGVGSGGNGFDNTLAINSGRPASAPLWRYLYQVLRPSIQSFLGV